MIAARQGWVVYSMLLVAVPGIGVAGTPKPLAIAPVIAAKSAAEPDSGLCQASTGSTKVRPIENVVAWGAPGRKPGEYVLHVSGTVPAAGWKVFLIPLVRQDKHARTALKRDTFSYEFEGCPPSGFAADVVSKVKASTTVLDESTDASFEGIMVHVYTGGRDIAETVILPYHHEPLLGPLDPPTHKLPPLL
ncbi:MAG: hypothetical protein M0037_05710 [Betaproteobacteria bacterium]|nr:hypothetical protein [Betaproteobacteria bacterium]